MNHTLARNQIMESNRSGAASVLDHSILLPRDELTELARKAKTGDPAAREQFVHAMSRWVYTVTSKVWMQWSSILPNSAQYDDIFHAGVEGMIYGLSKYDPDSGNSATTYLQLWIQQKAQRTIYNMLGNMNIPQGHIAKGLHPEDMRLAKMNLSIDINDGYGIENQMIDSCLQEYPSDYDDGAQIIMEQVEKLGPKYHIVALLASHGYTDPEIALRIKTSTARVNKMRHRIGEALVASGHVDASSVKSI